MTSSLINALSQLTSSLGGKWTEHKNRYSLTLPLAKRRVWFFSSKKLVYKAHLRIDTKKKELHFTELLKEMGWGLTSGDSDLTTGAGFKVETYKTTSGAREGDIKEQSRLFGKKYAYDVDVASVRKKVEALCKKHGYRFQYHISSLGL